MLKERGTLTAGKLADLVLIEGRPYQAIADVEKIRAVYLGGHQVDRGQLKASIAGTPTKFEPHRTDALLDDFEQVSGRAPGGQMWVDYTDSGHDRSRLQWTRDLRAPENHALLAMAHFGVKETPYARMTLPLVAGGLLPADVRKFHGVQFDVRGEGQYRLVVGTLGVRDGSAFAAGFDAGPAWKTVRVPFATLTRERARQTVAWTGDDVLSFAFEMTGQSGGQRWIELDNVRLFQ